MKILLAVPWDQEFGGVASVVGNLACHLQNQGHEIIFSHPGPTIFPKGKTTKWGFRSFEFRLQPPFGQRHPIIGLLAFFILFPISLFQLIKFIRRHGIQVVNVHYPTESSFYFALCRSILPFVLVTSVHGADFFPEGRPRDRYSRTMRFLLRSSDRIIAPSIGYQKDFLNVFPDLREQTTSIHNGVDLTELTALNANPTRVNQDPYLLCIAQHNDKKGLDVLLCALRLLHTRGMPAKLLLVGDGPRREKLQHLAASLGIDGSVVFLGEQRRADVVKLLQGCEVFVLPSRSEPFGIAIIEAMACHKPVVATSVGGIPEIIDNGKNGVLVPPDNPDALAEALFNVCKDESLQQRLGANGYHTVQERFRLEHNGASYESIFKQLCQLADSKEKKYPGAPKLPRETT